MCFSVLSISHLSVKKPLSLHVQGPKRFRTVTIWVVSNSIKIPSFDETFLCDCVISTLKQLGSMKKPSFFVNFDPIPFVK